MDLNRRRAIELLAVAGAAAGPSLAQAPTAPLRSADEELQIARAGRLRDAQRIATVKLPQDVEPAFRFRA